MAPVLTHPTTGRKVTVTDKQAGVYTDNGWVEPSGTSAEKSTQSKKEPADGTEAGSGKPTARKVTKAD